MKKQDLINNLKDHADFERKLYAFEKILNEREEALKNWHKALDERAEVLRCWSQTLKVWQQRLERGEAGGNEHLHASNN